MEDNMKLYESVRNVPDKAKKNIGGGRLKGMTDINPMWRIKMLTEQFGPCGIGWKYTIDKQWTENGSDGVVSAFCNISLYIRSESGEWSDPIPGTGGNSFVAKESSKLYTNDECYKSALTDALSVACKALGFGADVYWETDRTKYDKPETCSGSNGPQELDASITCAICGHTIIPWGGFSQTAIAAEGTKLYGRPICKKCAKAAQKKMDDYEAARNGE